MKGYIAACREALLQGLDLLERVADPRDALAHDLRALRVSLPPHVEHDPTTASTQTTRSPERDHDVVRLVAECVAALEAHRALDGAWAGRARPVLERMEALQGVERRAPLARGLRGLYVIVDPQVVRGDPLEAAAAALRGGACALQWRDKLHDKGDQLPVCRRLREMCARHDALFIVNDHADLAAACGADGLHVGQHDLPVAEARRSLGHGQIVGSSNATLAEAQASQGAGADYIAVGAIYPSPSKARTRPAGLETLRRVREIARVPVVAISGINEGNVAEVVAAGADAVAVISAVIAADDPEGAARRLLERIEAARRGVAPG